MKLYKIQIASWIFILLNSYHMLYKCDYGTCENNTCPYWLSIMFFANLYGFVAFTTSEWQKKVNDNRDKSILKIVSYYCLGLFIVNVFLINTDMPTYLAFCNSYLFGWLYTIATVVGTYFYCYKK